MCLNHEFIQAPSNPIQRAHHFISLQLLSIMIKKKKNPMLPGLLCHTICTKKYGNWYTNTTTNNKYTKECIHFIALLFALRLYLTEHMQWNSAFS